MFILFFAIFAFIFTVFENIFIGLIVFAIILGCIFLYRKNRDSLILFLAGSFLLTFLATSWKQYTYVKSIPITYKQITAWLTIYNPEPNPQLAYYLWTGQIVDTNSQGKYIFEDGEWRQYFLNTKKEYEIGDSIFLDGYVQAWRTDIHLLYKPRGQYIQFQNLFSGASLSWFFHYEFDYKTRMMMKWYYGTINEQNSIRLGNQQSSLIWKLRANLQKNVIEQYGKNRVSWLILWMLIGDKSQIPKADYQWFIDSWLVHLIAVSWWNIVMIVVFLGFILIFLPFYLRNFVILLMIIFYALICGLDSSVFRAVIMWWLGMIALFWWKEIGIYRSMATAFILMLLINPYYLAYDVGFLLSFGAIIGILYLQNGNIESNTNPSVTPWHLPLTGKRKIARKFITYCFESYIKPTLWATLGIFPLIIFFMGKINLVSLLWNFFVLPIVPFVMIYWFISTRAYRIVGWKWIIMIEEFLINYIYKVSELIWQKWVYLMVDWDWIKYLILIISIGIFLVYKVTTNPRSPLTGGIKK